jgi:hypothetical protein
MAKQLLWANVRVPEIPRARFYIRSQAGYKGFEELSGKVAKLVIEDLEDDTGYHALLRLAADGSLVWRTKHPSLLETKWLVEFEYGLPEDKWETTA